MRSEADFISAIDCCFPYEDTARATELIEEACSISADAAFMVVHELARRPCSSKVVDSVCLALLEQLDHRFSHPLKDMVLNVARRMVRRQSLPFEEFTKCMHQVACHRGQYNALAVIYFACNDDYCLAAADELHEAILARWRA